ncbi:MAG: endonuclease/exonuclease/phosphatase family protein [Tepidisphaeraceae bacterium]
MPFRTGDTPGVYDVFAAIAFFTRVFLWPMALGWAVLAGVSLFCRRRGVAVICLILAVGWLVPEVWMAWPRRAKPAGPGFSVASFNLNKDLKDAAWAGRVMRQMNADFVALQELSPHAADQLAHDLADVYPYRVAFPDEGYNGMAVFARTPLAVEHAPESYEKRDLVVSATALGRAIVLADIHFAPPQHSEKRRRNRWQIGEFVARFANETRPMLLAGDYNFTAMTPNAFALRQAGFSDAQLQAARGRGATWPAPSAHSIVPTVRIDTVYVRGPLTAVETEVGPDIGSDHRPIKTTWNWAKSE